MLIPQPPQGSFQPSPATAEDSSETENFTRFPLLSHTFIFQLYQQLRGLAENRCFGFWFGGIFFFLEVVLFWFVFKSLRVGLE